MQAKDCNGGDEGTVGKMPITSRKMLGFQKFHQFCKWETLGYKIMTKSHFAQKLSYPAFFHGSSHIYL